MDTDTAELWGGAGLLVLAALALLAPLLVAVEYTLPLFVVAVIGLAVGAVLVGLSRRGRAV